LKQSVSARTEAFSTSNGLSVPYEDTMVDVDSQGNICAITVEHASTRADAPHFSYEEIAA
jgi:hypothetical protein